MLELVHLEVEAVTDLEQALSVDEFLGTGSDLVAVLGDEGLEEELLGRGWVGAGALGEFGGEETVQHLLGRDEVGEGKRGGDGGGFEGGLLE